jgi:Spy/CpxP family protein refolding chaperone
MSSLRSRRRAIAYTTLSAALLVACGGESGTGAAVASAPAQAGPSTAPPPPPAAPPAAAPPPAVAAQGVGAAPPSAPPSSPAATAPAAASPSGAEMAEGDEAREKHHGGFLTLVLASTQDLDLRPDQRSQIDKIRADLLAKMEPAHTAGKELAGVLADGVAAGKIDRAKVDASIAKLVSQVQGLHEATIGSLDQLHAALDAAQRAAFVAALQSHWERWADAHGRDESDDRQHRAGYLLALVRQLGLTKEQAETIRTNFREQMKARPQDHLHKEVKDHLRTFSTAFKADTFSAKALGQGKAANAHMASWGAMRRARFLEAAAPVLSPEQRAKLSQMIRDHANRADS